MAVAEFPGLGSYVTEWTRFAAKPNPATQERLRTRVLSLYQEWGLRQPQVIFCAGPWQMAAFPMLADFMLTLGQAESNRSTFLPIRGKSAMEQAEWDAFWAAVRSQIDWSLPAQLPGKGIGVALNEIVQQKLLRPTEVAGTREVDRGLGSRRSEQLEKEFVRRLWRSGLAFENVLRLARNERNVFVQEVENRLPPKFRALHESGARDASGTKIIIANRHVHKTHPAAIEWALIGQWQWQWLARFDYARTRLGVELTPNTAAQMDALVDMHTSGALLFFSNACFVMLRPTRAEFDDEWRPHCESDVALRFADGTDRYMWHGFQIPSEWITHPDRIVAEDIDKVENIEMRRVMIDIYGLERYLRARKAVRVHEDRFGILYRVHHQGDEDLLVVRVVNSTPEADGTFKNYFLRVPPTVRTAREAVAWTFGVHSDDYAPEFET